VNFYDENSGWHRYKIDMLKDNFLADVVSIYKNYIIGENAKEDFSEKGENWKERIENSEIKQQKNSKILDSQDFCGLIYKIVNKLNSKVYIGKTSRALKRRWREHIRRAKDKVPLPLYRAMNKYGLDNFVIKIIKYCKNSKDLNEKEIELIEKYKSFIGKYGHKYGYNLTPGGDGANKIDIDKDIIKKLIKALLSLDEIASILDVSLQTVSRNIEEKFRMTVIELRESLNLNDLFDNRVKEKISKTWLGKSEIKQNLLESLISEGLTSEEIAKKLGTYRSTITRYVKNFWNKTLTEKRKELGIFNLYKKRLVKKQVISRFNSKTTDFHQYKKIEKDYLFFLIKCGLNIKELANELDMSSQGIRNKIYEIWGKSLTELRGELGILETIRKKRQRKIIKALKEESVDSETLESAIKEGLSAMEIADKLGIHYKTVYEKILQYWNMSISEKRKELGVQKLFKSRISEKMKESGQKIYIKKDISSEEILKKINGGKNRKYKYKKSHKNKDNNVQVKKERDARELNSNSKQKNKDKLKKTKEKDQIKHIIMNELEYQVSVDEIINYLSKGLSLDELSKKLKLQKTKVRDILIPKTLDKNYLEAIDSFYWKPRLLKLISKGLSVTEIAQKLDKDRSTIYKAVERVLGINFTEANEKLYWKPSLKKYLTEFLSIRQIAQNFGVNEKTIRNRIKRIWNLTPKQARKKFINEKNRE